MHRVPWHGMALNLRQVSHTFLTLNEIILGDEGRIEIDEKLMCRIYIFIFMKSLRPFAESCH